LSIQLYYRSTFSPHIPFPIPPAPEGPGLNLSYSSLVTPKHSGHFLWIQ
jgi:hypothetical protein